MIDFDAFNSDLLDTDVFAQSVTFTPAGGQAKTVTAVVELKPEELALGGDIAPQAIAGRAGCKASDVLGAKLNDTLEAGAVTYRILKVEVDETGWATLFLGKRY
jgi:hypothetical protein